MTAVTLWFLLAIFPNGPMLTALPDQGQCQTERASIRGKGYPVSDCHMVNFVLTQEAAGVKTRTIDGGESK